MNNIAFSKVLKMNGRLWEFNFRKLPGDSNEYHTDFTDAKDNRIQFILFHDQRGAWQVRGSFIPTWIIDDIALLGQAIDEFAIVPS